MIELRYDAVPTPRIDEAHIDLQLRTDDESIAVVYFPAVTVDFSRKSPNDPWTGGLVSSRGNERGIDERYIRTARELAVECLRRELAARGANDESDIVRCSECERLIVSSEIKGTVFAVVSIECGPTHSLRFGDGRTLNVDHSGSARWRA